MPRVLLLLPTHSWRAEALLTACRRLGVEATVGTDRPLVWADRTPERVITLDYTRPGVAAEQVADFSRRHPLAAVVGADDETTVLAATFSAFLGLPHNPIGALNAARDKLAQREALSDAGLPVPPFTRVWLDEDPEAIAEIIGFPCVVKPLRLSGSRGVMRADDVASLQVALCRLAAMLASPEVGACGEAAESAIVEAFVPGREVAVEGLMGSAGGAKPLRTLAIFDKPDPLDGPFFEETIYVTPSRLPLDIQEEITELTAWAAVALGLKRGPVHAELRVNERGICLVELAARPIGGLCSRALRFREGRSLEELVIMDALGMDTGALSPEPRSSAVMMLPIPREGILERVEGQGDAAKVPGIEQVTITAHPGERMVPFPEGSRYPGFLFARGDDPAATEEALRAAHRKLRFVMRAPGTPATPAPEADAPVAGEPVGSR